jgi:hypothetical protein
MADERNDIIRGMLMAALFLPALCVGAGHGPELNPTGAPIGGGAGYRALVSAGQAQVVASKAELLGALARAPAGAVIYVRDDVTIDLTGSDDLTIPGGVTLASGRGRGDSLGAMIYSNSLTGESLFIPMLKTGGKGVRITGLRLRGPFAEIGDHHYEVRALSVLTNAVPFLSFLSRAHPDTFFAFAGSVSRGSSQSQHVRLLSGGVSSRRASAVGTLPSGPLRLARAFAGPLSCPNSGSS